MKTFAVLISFVCCAAAHAAPPSQSLVEGEQGPHSINLRESDLCVSEEGESFKRMKSGMACEKGDLTYAHLPFDSDRAANLAQELCDFQRTRPPEAMDVYGVLCYAKIAPPVGKAKS